MSNIEKIQKTAKDTGYVLVFEKPEQKLLRFSRDGAMVDVWHSRMTVAVYPEDGETVIYLKNVDVDDLFEMMMSPSSYRYPEEAKVTRRWSR